MHINSTTITCVQKHVTVSHQNLNVSQENSTQIIAVVRARTRSQLWIPYVLIGFGCVAFLAVHFWCYHKRNRERYLRKREEIRVKCGLLERRRITTLMMARNRSEQFNAENNSKKNDEENALLGVSFCSQDSEFFNSQTEESSYYYDTLLDGIRKTDVTNTSTKPHIGCCLTCSVSMPTGMKTSTAKGGGKNRSFVHQSKSFGDSLDRPDKQSLKMKNKMYDFSQDYHLVDRNINVKVKPVLIEHYGRDRAEMECMYEDTLSNHSSSSSASTKHTKVRCYDKAEKRNNYVSTSGDGGKGMFPLSRDDVQYKEYNGVDRMESDQRRDGDELYYKNHFQSPRKSYTPDEIVQCENVINNLGQNTGTELEKCPQFTSTSFAATHQSEKDDVFSHENPNNLNLMNRREMQWSNPGKKTVPRGDKRHGEIPNVNSVNNEDKHVATDYPMDSRVCSNWVNVASLDSVDDKDDEDKQSSLKTPALRSLNPRIVFGNLHHNAK